ncbi:Glycoside hydrolase family 16 [Macrophomina phaseolina MS6]|uniref:Glycoside hydrolase family 16 n=1 Tax=Macrophomina phaseolina (strain MS6) TaxID=1126212 RepID=K2RED9_MACPH|nr:Glycoside hydrolase family 16 [Macrophomina phaseolina MS6]
MTTYAFDDSELSQLRGKTILIIGAASGIGHETVKLAHSYGANVAIGDWNAAQGQALATELHERVFFRKCDVSSWDDVLELFQETWKTFGPIHAVLSNAGINKEDIFKDVVDYNTGKLLPPDTKIVEVNLLGMVYVVKCAVHYFAKWPETRCQIVLTGSAASFLDTPPLHLYCASKAGVLGFMRSLRTQLVSKNITINMVAPWMTTTAMTKELAHPWVNEWQLPANTPDGVGRALLMPVVRPDVNGKSFFVAGNKIVEFEDKLHAAQPRWMGEELSKHVDEGQRRLLPGDAPWTTNC